MALELDDARTAAPREALLYKQLYNRHLWDYFLGPDWAQEGLESDEELSSG